MIPAEGLLCTSMQPMVAGTIGDSGPHSGGGAEAVRREPADSRVVDLPVFRAMQRYRRTPAATIAAASCRRRVGGCQGKRCLRASASSPTHAKQGRVLGYVCCGPKVCSPRELGARAIPVMFSRGLRMGRRLGMLVRPELFRLPGKRSSAPVGAAGRQIICITHLSQIAAYADHHLQISKELVGREKVLARREGHG